MEEFLLRRFLARDELDIVDQERVGLAVFFAEAGRRTGADGFDQLVRELVALDVDDRLFGEVLFQLVADRVQQVRLAEAELP